MAFRFGDPGGRIYTSVGTSNVNLLAHWTAVAGQNPTNAVPSVSAGNGRTSGSALLITHGNTNGSCSFQKNLDAQATWGVAWAMKGPLPTGTVTLVQLLDAGSLQCDLRLASDGTLSITRNGTALGSTAAGVFPANTWTHLEFKVKVDPSAGTAQLWVNGVAKINLTGQNTRATANSTASQVTVGYGVTNANNPASGSTYLDDVIVYDGQTTDPQGNASAFTGPIGDCGLTWLLPTGAGTNTQWTADSGSNYARVNEATPDGDASYVQDGTAGDLDTYAMADLPAGASSVKAVAAVHYARKNDTGARAFQAEVRTNSVNFANSGVKALGDTYQYFFSPWDVNPSGTPAAWSVANVNAIEVGQVVNS